MERASGDPRLAFQQAADFYLATVDRIRAEQWDQPGLGVWSVRDLVGHTSRAFLTVETYLDRPASEAALSQAADYVVAAQAMYGNPADVAQRGREAGAALGADPVAAVHEIAARVLQLVARADDGALLATPMGGIRLIDYLPTRVFELVVHTLDLATAIGVAAEPPTEAAGLCLQLAAEVVARSGKAAPVLLALSGRGPLPAGFSIM
jgi:uncharacterized protein (TIGR03083 family)